MSDDDSESEKPKRAPKKGANKRLQKVKPKVVTKTPKDGKKVGKKKASPTVPDDDEDDDAIEETKKPKVGKTTTKPKKKAEKKKAPTTKRKTLTEDDDDDDPECQTTGKETKTKKSPKKEAKTGTRQKRSPPSGAPKDIQSEEEDDPEKAEEPEVLDGQTAEILRKKGYILGGVLHRGRHSVVLRARKEPVTGSSPPELALRVLFLERVKGDPRRQLQKFLPREMATLATVRHCNAIQVYDIVRVNSKVIIAMELLAGGNLNHYLSSQGPLGEEQAARWFTAVASVVASMHEDYKLAHRNLKSENIFPTGDTVKLSLSGFPIDCWDFERNQPLLALTICGTFQYKSPQLHRNRPYNPYAADCWALGVILYQLLNAAYPFTVAKKDATLMMEQQRSLVRVQSAAGRYSAELADLQVKLLAFEEETRLTIGQVMGHAWIRNTQQQ